MIDIETLQQLEATKGQYIFNFILMNLIFLLSYINRNKRRNIAITWLLALVFVVFAYWDTDYFTFRPIFYSPELATFRDPLYYYLSLISVNSYTVFRLIIWGLGLYFFKKTVDRLNISRNIAIYIFVVFFNRYRLVIINFRLYCIIFM